MGGNPRHLFAGRAARSRSEVGADLPTAQTAAIAVLTSMENRTALYPSGDDRRTLRFGSASDPFFMHLPSPVEMRPCYPGLGDFQKTFPT